MTGRKYYTNEYMHDLRLAYIRSRAQAKFRDEEWRLTFEDFQKVWPEEMFQKRGRSSQNLVLTRFNRNKPWNLRNCCIISRKQNLKIIRATQLNLPIKHLFEGAITYEPKR